MHLAVFENAFFLRSLGWAIANSFWQAGLLWMIYICYPAINKKVSATFKHNLGISLVMISLAWFIFTLFSSYYTITRSAGDPDLLVTRKWIIHWEYANRYLPFLSLAYLALLCLFGRKFLSSYFKTRFIQNNGLVRAPVDLRIFAGNTAVHLGIKRKVQVWISEHVDVPSMIGFIKPVILLPVAVINDLTPQQVEAILLHELVHIKRHDYLLNIIQSVIELILFFNPFVALLNSNIRKEREHCCDDWVMNYQYNNHDYARALLVLEEQRRQQLFFTVAATNGKKNLLNRIKRLFNTEPEVNINLQQKIQLGAVTILLLLGIAAVFPSLQGLSSYSNGTGITENSPAIPLSSPLLIADISPLITKEIPAIVNNQPAVKTKKENILPVRKSPRKPKPTTNTEDFTIALINEELLNDPSLADFKISQVINKDEDPNARQYIIKLEEERSGKKNSTVYYFEVKKSNGKTTFKPLLFLNELPDKKAPAKKLKDTSLKPARRITS